MILLLLTIFLSSQALAQDSVYDPVNRKMREKVRTRWALENIIVPNRKSKAMEQWMPLNLKKGPHFELMADARFGMMNFMRIGYDPKKRPTKAAGGGLQIHFGPVGIGIQRDQYKFSSKEQYWERDEGTFYLRILGSSTQTTHLTLLTGTQKSEHAFIGNYEQSYYGALANLYIFRHFGLEGQYRYKKSIRTDSHYMRGVEQHWGFFGEMSILRVYVLFRLETNNANQTRVINGNEYFYDDREYFKGFVLGARLNF